MKKFNTNFDKLRISSLMLLIHFIGFTAVLHAQPAGTAVELEMKKFYQVSPNSFTYEMYCKNTGTTAMALTAYSWGINTTPGLANGGTISQTFLARDPLFGASFPAISLNSSTANHLRATAVPGPAGSEVPILPGAQILLGKIKVSTSASLGFPLLFNPFLPAAPLSPLQLQAQTGLTRCITTMLIPYSGSGTGISYPLVAPILSGIVTPSPTSSLPFLLNCDNSGLSTVFACNSYYWGGANRTASGIYTHTFVNVNGCDSIHTLSLTINYSTSNTTTVTACDTYTWWANGSTYNTSGTYTFNSVNASGCTHTEILNLTIVPSTNDTIIATACGAYTWACNGVTYNTSGYYLCTADAGPPICKTHVLCLTMWHDSTVIENVNACDSFYWHGNWRYSSGTYTDILPWNIYPICTIFYTLNLNIALTTTTNVSASGTYYWPPLGTLTASGTYTAPYPYCQILNLNLCLDSNFYYSENVCGSYYWQKSGQTYTSSGVYTYINNNGCGAEAKHHLTLNVSNGSKLIVTACNAYTWIPYSNTYTASGTYYSGYPNCDTLVLTLHHDSIHDTIVTACDSFYWETPFHLGEWLKFSGTYTRTWLNPYGCEHLETLHLYIGAAALNFDGVNDFISVPYISGQDLGNGNFTIEATTKFFTSQTSIYPTIISRRAATNTGYIIFAYNQRLYVQIAGISYGPFGPTNIYDDTCRHIALTRVGNNFTFYLDGNIIGNFSSTANLNVSAPLYIGKHNVPSSFMKGSIDEVRIWNFARTQAELKNTAMNSLNLPQNGLIAYFQFNEGIPLANNSQLSMVLDKSIQAQHGSFNGFNLTGNFSNYVAPCVQCPCCVQHPTSLVAWWPLDELSGVYCYDIEGGHYGQIGANVAIANDGKVFKSHKFTNNKPSTDADVVKVQNSPDLNFGYGDMTIDAWIKWTTPGVTGCVSIVKKGTAYDLRIAGPGIGLHLHLGGWHSHGPAVPTDNQWHHIAAVVSQNNWPAAPNVRYYIDGVNLPNMPGTWTLTGANLSDNSPLYIGGSPETYGNIFPGSVDEVEIFSKALSTAEIQKIYNAGICGKCKSSYPVQGADIWMQDSPQDIGLEPNTTLNPIWLSNDLWIRNQADGMTNQISQKPEYYSVCNPSSTQSNFVYARIRNRGTTATPGNEELKVYWSLSNTGTKWPIDWQNKFIGGVLYGDEISNHYGNTTILLPPIQPGQSIIKELKWCAPNPSNFLSIPNSNQVSLLARIVGNNSFPGDFITFPEIQDVKKNVQNNNNIVLRNTRIVDRYPYKWNEYLGKWNLSSTLSIKLQAPNSITNNLFNYGQLEVDLGNEIHQLWVLGGMQGNGVTAGTGNKVIFNSINSWIGGIAAPINEVHQIQYNFILATQPVASVNNIFDLDVVSYLSTLGTDSLYFGGRIALDFSCPKAILNGIPTICGGMSTLLQAIDLNEKAITYQWKLNGVNIPAATNSSYSASLPGTYSIVMMDEKACSSSASLNVITYPGISANASIVSAISCNGASNGSVTLNASGGVGYYWYQMERNSNMIDYPNNNYSNLSAGSYSLWVRDSVGCSKKVEIVINEPAPIVNSVTISVPNSYSWSATGLTYTSSGIYTQTSMNVAGCVIIDELNLNITGANTILNLNCFIEGYWDGLNAMRPVLMNQNQFTTIGACDTIEVELRSSNFPYASIASTKTVLQQDGSAICSFPPISGNYYIVLKHRNAIATWSSNAISFGLIPTNYNFTSANSKAYGSNQTEVATGIWALYSGDFNHDENIDLGDYSFLEFAINNFEFGYTSKDINGDGNVDLGDVPYLESNISQFIFSNHP